jgi:hypothetical protein
MHRPSGEKHEFGKSATVATGGSFHTSRIATIRNPRYHSRARTVFEPVQRDAQMTPQKSATSCGTFSGSGQVTRRWPKRRARARCRDTEDVLPALVATRGRKGKGSLEVRDLSSSSMFRIERCSCMALRKGIRQHRRARLLFHWSSRRYCIGFRTLVVRSNDPARKGSRSVEDTKPVPLSRRPLRCIGATDFYTFPECS